MYQVKYMSWPTPMITMRIVATIKTNMRRQIDSKSSMLIPATNVIAIAIFIIALHIPLCVIVHTLAKFHIYILGRCAVSISLKIIQEVLHFIHVCIVAVIKAD